MLRLKLFIVFSLSVLTNLNAQYDVNILVPDTISYLGQLNGVSYYHIENMGEDTFMNFFEKKEITLSKVKHPSRENLTFWLDGTFEFQYGLKRMFGEMRVYDDDMSNGVVHTSDTISWVAYSLIKGQYTIGNDNMITLKVIDYLPRGEDYHNTIILENKMICRYKLVLKGKQYILLKQ